MIHLFFILSLCTTYMNAAEQQNTNWTFVNASESQQKNRERALKAQVSRSASIVYNQKTCFDYKPTARTASPQAMFYQQTFSATEVALVPQLPSIDTVIKPLITINHPYVSLYYVISEYDQNDRFVKDSTQHVYNQQIVVPLKTHCNTDRSTIQLLLPTAPRWVEFSVNNKNMYDTFIIRDSGDIVTVENQTKAVTLFNLIKKNACLPIGKPSFAPGEQKIISFANSNIPSISIQTLTEILTEQGSHRYPELLYTVLPNGPVCTMAVNSFSKAKGLFKTVIIITMTNGLAKICINPEDDVIQNDDILNIGYTHNDHLIKIVNQRGQCLTQVPDINFVCKYQPLSH